MSLKRFERQTLKEKIEAKAENKNLETPPKKKAAKVVQKPKMNKK